MTEKVLCIDIGNTRIKWALYQLQKNQLLKFGVANSVDELAAALQVYSAIPVYCSLVRDEQIKEQIMSWFEENWSVTPVFLQTEAQFGVLKNAYSNPAELGVDRWLAMVAAQSLCERNFCVIDTGTAVTIDVVDVKGQHLGGVIMPGMQLMLSALNQNTANISVTYGEFKIPAENTADAVVSGVMSAWLGGIQYVIDGLLKKYQNMEIFITGGDAEYLRELYINNAVFNKELVLKGIGLVARKHYA